MLALVLVSPRRIGVLLVIQQLEIDVDDELHFDGLAIEEERLVFPLRHSIYRGFDEQRVPLFGFNFLDGAVTSDEAFQCDRAGDMYLPG